MKTLKSKIRNIDFIFKIYFFLKTELSILKYRFGATPVLIYNLGKVGSSSVRKSLVSSNKYAVFNAHKLTENGLLRQKKFEGVGKKQADYKMATYLAKRLKNIFFNKNTSRLKIVALTRLPVSRGVSAIFESILVDRPTLQSDILQNKINVNDLVSYYENECVIPDKNMSWDDFPADWKAGPLAFDWVEKELINMTGLNIYETSFDKERGYKIYKNHNIDLLVIRLENLKDVAKQAFNEFLGCDDFSLINTNVGEEKFYAPIYKEFKRNLKLDEDYLNSMHTTKYAKYFYTDAELEKEKLLFIK